MKKNLKGLFYVLGFILLCLILTGCGESNEDNKEGTAEDIKNWVLENVKTNVTEDLSLPKTHPSLGGTITWESTDDEYITSDGEIVSRSKSKAVDVEFRFIVTLGDDIDGDYITFHLSPITLEEAERKFESLFEYTVVNKEKQYHTNKDIDFPNNYYGVIIVDINTSNPEVLSCEGKYTRPVSDATVKISVTFSDGYRSIDKEYSMVIPAMTKAEIFQAGCDWMDHNFVDQLLTEETVFPTELANGVTVSWKSSDENIVTNDGKVTQSVFDRYVEIVATISYSGFSETRDYWCKVKALDTSKMTESEILEKYIDAITPNNVKQMSFNAYYKNLTQSYGYVYFFDGTGPNITRAIIKDTLDNKANANRPSTEFICVHDTGNNGVGAGELAHSNFINNGGGGASWHYTVGDEAIYQQVEDVEIAWHAGDGSRLYGLNDTGVKATALMPTMTFSDDGYYVLAGQKTKIRIPSDTKNKRTGPYGIYTEIGPNGNYWINNSHYDSTFGAISNNGGNRNSVSMESCVDQGSDYVKCFINVAKLVTHLLRKYDLSCDRIMQHNNFSGKDCPLAIRHDGEWARLKDLCSAMKFGLDNLSDYEFNWTSDNPTKMTNTGLITLKASKGEKLNYSVSVKKNNIEVYTNSFTVSLI